MKAKTIRLRGSIRCGKRLDAGFHLSQGVRARELIARSPLGKTSVDSVTADIYSWTRGRRIYVSNKCRGTPFFGGATMLRSDLSGIKLLSNKYTEDLENALLKRDCPLISCSGTIGKAIYSTAVIEGMAASQHVMRVIPNDVMMSGLLYAFFASKFGYALLTQGSYGSVISELSPDYIKSLEIPIFPDKFQKRVHSQISESARLREEAHVLDKMAQQKLRAYTGLAELSSEDYNYFGPRSASRVVSTFARRLSSMTELTFQAFNYSERTRKWIEYCKRTCSCVSLREVLDECGLFSTGSFPRLELDSPKSYLLINQTDIFNQRLSGKKIARRGVKIRSLVQYGEVIIAGVGTLGESETFCRVVFGNEMLTGQLISGEFIRMNTNKEYPSGYLYAWLHSDYGFRLIRSTQAGTKLCRPIQKLLLGMPVPVLERRKMNEIDRLVRESQTKLSTAAELEEEAIGAVEAEIESWQGA